MDITERNKIFDAYESGGFVSYFFNAFDLLEKDEPYLNKPFSVVKRTEIYETDEPSWIIRFEDGYEMRAFPPEICKSEIPDWLTKESSAKFMDLASKVYSTLIDFETYPGQTFVVSGIEFSEWISNPDMLIQLTSECRRLMILHPKECAEINICTVVRALRNVGSDFKRT